MDQIPNLSALCANKMSFSVTFHYDNYIDIKSYSCIGQLQLLLLRMNR